MDHSHMGHGDMGHGDMGGHQCNMNMLFTWDTTDLCIVFRQWHVSGTWSLIASLMGVILLTAGYEFVRELSRRYEARTAVRGVEGIPTEGEESSLLYSGSISRSAEQRAKTIRGIFYAVQVFYSFFIMLLFMTYNGWVMLAVAVGAFLGYSAFGQAPATKTVACH